MSVINYTICIKYFMNQLISSEELYRKTQKRDHYIIVDTRPFSEFKKGHIPSALNVDLFQLHWFDTSKRGIKNFAKQTKMMLSTIGIKKETNVVFCDNVSGISAARGVWLVLYFSHKMVSMLDEGFEKWRRDGYPVELNSNPLKYHKFRGKVDTSILATANEIERSLKRKILQLWTLGQEKSIAVQM